MAPLGPGYFGRPGHLKDSLFLTKGRYPAALGDGPRSGLATWNILVV